MGQITMARRTRSARVAARAKAGNGIRRTSTGTRAPKPTELDDDLDGDDSGDDTGDDDSDDDTDDDDDSDDGAGDDDDSDDDDDVDPETEFLAGLTEAQAKFYSESTGGLKTKLTKANASARKHRLARAALQGAGAGTGAGAGGAGAGTQPPKPGAKKDAPVDQAAMLAQLKSEMAAEAEQKELLRTAADALVEAGLVLPTDKVARRRALSKAVRMLELDGAEADDVDDEVEALKAEMPGLFRTPRRKPAAGPGGPKKANGSKATLGGEIEKLFG